MFLKKNNPLIKVAVGALVWLASSNYNSSLQAQVVPDNTLGNENSQVNSVSPQEQQIEGGAIRDTNLFHSFSEFNIGENQIVNFVNPANIENIFSRVTGNNISGIQGSLGVLGNANLFLINPNGISFGESASLNVNGSFIGTTATSINFTDGTSFDTNPASGEPLLTINQPNALQFGNQPGTIINRSQSFEQAEITNQFNSNGLPAGLAVPIGETLALIGGEIIAEGGNFTAAGGKIELGSVGANSTVGIEINSSDITFDFQAVTDFADISLTSRAALVPIAVLDENGNPVLDENGELIFEDIDFDLGSNLDAASTESTGSINIQGRNVNIFNGSVIQTFTATEFAGGNITINAQEGVNLGIDQSIQTSSDELLFPSFIVSSTVGVGDAGNIDITTSNLSIQDGGAIASNSSVTSNFITGELIFATGNAGSINIITSDSISLSSGGVINSDSLGEGQAGQISLQTDNLSLTDDNSSINVSASGTGLAGDIIVQANSVTLDSGSDISAATTDDGNAGNIEIITSSLSIQNQAEISSESNFAIDPITEENIPATGDAGAINIFASDSISLSSEGEINSSSVGEGQAGQLDIQTNNLSLSDDASINVNAAGSGLAGDIIVQTNSVTLDSGSDISAETTQSDGGNINLQIAENLELRNQGGISASVGGDGNGGNINIVSQFVVTSPQDNSDITANADFGQGGNITIETSGLFGIEFQDQVTESSDITVSSNFGADGSFNLVDFEIRPQENDATSNVVFTDLDTKFTSEHCYANRYNSYIQTGRGGIPLASQSASLSKYTWEDWRFIDEQSNSASAATKPTPEINKTTKDKSAAQGEKTEISQSSIQGWLVNQRGEIILTAKPIVVTPQAPAQSIPGC